MSNSESTVPAKIFQTDRKDNWWLGPLLTAFGLGSFGIYSTWAAFQGEHFQWGPYLSPLYSPLIQFEGMKISPAFLILWIPLGFRATCYYYRKAYYRAFFLDPVGCSVGEHRGRSYKGEQSFPFIIQNAHRYFMFLAVALVAVLWWDVIEAFMWHEDGATHFGMGLGTLIMMLNTILLTAYTFGCHSLRHLVGGGSDTFSCCKSGQVRYKGWLGVSLLNRSHMLFAWLSLIVVGFTDFYIRMCAMGYFSDIRFF